jgi:hypothetical protein
VRDATTVLQKGSQDSAEENKGAGAFVSSTAELVRGDLGKAVQQLEREALHVY